MHKTGEEARRGALLAAASDPLSRKAQRHQASVSKRKSPQNLTSVWFKDPQYNWN
jgi:hypothetical protein